MSERAKRHPQYQEAKSAAVKLLGFRARTRRHLEDKLRGKGVPVEATEQALDDLQRAGYIDDESYARDRVEALLRQSKRGPVALKHALIQDGLDGHLVERVVSQRLEDEDPGEWALEVAMQRVKRLRGLDADTARRRLYGYLSRRGFDEAHVLRATEEALDTLNQQQ